MRNQALLWSFTALYYFVVGIIYLALSGDPAGATVLLIGAPFGGLIAGWLWHAQRTGLQMAADRVDGDASDELGLIGSFTTDSLRPLALAVGFVGTVLGLVMGLWMTGTGLAIVASQIALIVRDADQ